MTNQNETPEDDEFEQAFNEFSSGIQDDIDAPEDTPEHDEGLTDNPENPEELETDTEEENPSETPGQEEPEQEEDPLTGLNDTQKQALEKIQAEAQDWKHRYESDAGRVSALQRKINDLENSMRNQPSAEQIKEVVTNGSEEEIKTFKEDFPEIANAINLMVSSELKAHQNQIMGEVQKRDQYYQNAITPLQQQHQEQEKQAHIRALTSRHPDWREVSESASFRDWAARQPPAVQSMIASDYADDASYVLDTFKSMSGYGDPTPPEEPEDTTDVDTIVAKRQQVLENAATPKSKAGKPKTGVPDDFDAAFSYYASKRK